MTGVYVNVMFNCCYRLVRQHELDEAMSIALSSQSLIPPIHVLRCLTTSCELDELSLDEAHNMFAAYIQSTIQQLDVSNRYLIFICLCIFGSKFVILLRIRLPLV